MSGSQTCRVCRPDYAVARHDCTKNDLQIFKEAQDLMPGGVNSPVRAFRSVGGSPIIFESVKVSMAWCHLQHFDCSIDRALAPPGTGDVPSLHRVRMYFE
jgi:hypothetical protein